MALALALSISILGLGVGASSPSDRASATSTSRAMPAWAKSATMYEVNIRAFTPQGTFNAFKAHLPRLKKLGVKILWLMPIHPISLTHRNGSLGSPYAVDNYREVNPDMGTAADFKSLIKAAHAQGFKVVMDWVANHTGWDNPWIHNAGWYTTVNGVIQPPNRDWLDVADLNYGNADMRAAMISAMKYWVTDFNVDGFRCDYANGVPTDFWETASTELQAVKPILMLAESEGDSSELVSAFNANYSWSLLNRMNSTANYGGDASSLGSAIDVLNFNYSNGTFPLTFITNHDQNAWNGTEYERLGGFVNRFSALYFTAPGMPLIYSGQEVGLKTRLRLFEKDAIAWSKSPMTAFYTKLVSLKTKNPALWNGSYGGEAVVYDGTEPMILTYSRTVGKNHVIVAINLQDTKASTTIDTGAGLKGNYFNFATGKAVKVSKNSLKVAVPGKGFVIYSTVKVG
jgi:glycosidase